jgi:hypothetical protein
MKKLIFLIAILFAWTAVSAQFQNKGFDNDTIKGDTTTYVSNKKVTKHNNMVVIFAFTKVDVTDSLSVAKIQGSTDNSEFYDITDASANLTETSTDGRTRLYVENPLDLYFRGFLGCATGDTVAVTNADLIIKEDD